MTAAEGFDVLRTPAYKAALRRLMAAGTWVERQAFSGCSQSPVALEDALADLVMLGQAEYRPEAGYRLKQPAVARQAAQKLLAQPHLRESMEMRQVAGGVHLGIARRTGPEDLDVTVFAMVVAAPVDASDGEALTHAAEVQAAVGRFWGKEERRGQSHV